MNAQQTHNNLPLKGNLLLIHVSSFLIAILMTVASVAGFRSRALIYPTEELVRTFVPNDVVNLLIGLPILLGSMWLTRRKKLIGLLCWPGAIFFVFYNYIAYVFAMPLSWPFLLHLVLAMLSAYVLIGLVSTIDSKSVQERLSRAVPEKFAGGILAGLGLLLLLRVVGVLVSSISSRGLLAETELAVNVADFLITPAWIIGGILLWQRKPIGYVTGLGLFFQGSMLFIALIAFLLLQPFLAGIPFAIADVVVIVAMGSICFIPFVFFVRGTMTNSTK